MRITLSAGILARTSGLPLEGPVLPPREEGRHLLGDLHGEAGRVASRGSSTPPRRRPASDPWRRSPGSRPGGPPWDGRRRASATASAARAPPTRRWCCRRSPAPSAWAAGSSSSGGRTRETRRPASASSARKSRPVATHSMAWLMPTIRGRNQLLAASGTMPRRAKTKPMRARGAGEPHVHGQGHGDADADGRAVDGGDHRLLALEDAQRDLAAAVAMAIQGLLRAGYRRSGRQTPDRRRRRRPGPAPVTTTARTSSLASISSKTPRSSCCIRGVKAFRRSGRLRVSVSTRSRSAFEGRVDMTSGGGGAARMVRCIVPWTTAPTLEDEQLSTPGWGAVARACPASHVPRGPAGGTGRLFALRRAAAERRPRRAAPAESDRASAQPSPPTTRRSTS